MSNKSVQKPPPLIGGHLFEVWPNFWCLREATGRKSANNLAKMPHSVRFFSSVLSINNVLLEKCFDQFFFAELIF